MVSLLDILNFSHHFFPLHAPPTKTGVSTNASLKFLLCVFPLRRHPFSMYLYIKKKSIRASAQYYKN